MAMFTQLMDRFTLALVLSLEVLCQEPPAGGGSGPQAPPGEPGYLLTVDNAAEFCPSMWRFRVMAPSDRPTEVVAPSIQFFSRMPNNEWWLVSDAPGRDGYVSGGVADWGAHSKRPVWVCPPGASIEFACELSDWRVIGFPGVYKALVRTPGVVWSQEFTVVEGGADCAPLVEARAAGNALWDAYKKFMAVSVAPRAVRASGAGLGSAGATLSSDRRVPFGPTSSIEGRATMRMINNHVSAPRQILGAVELLPLPLRDRIRLSQVLDELSVAASAPDDAERAHNVAQLHSQCQVLALRPGVVGTLAKYQVLVNARANGVAEFDAMRTAARGEPVFVAAVRFYCVDLDGIGVCDEVRKPMPVLRTAQQSTPVVR